MSVATNLISFTRDIVQPGFPAEWLPICRGGHNVLFEGPLTANSTNPRQVICSTTASLFPLVARGLFDETLYYRLNVVMVRIRGRDGLE